MRSPWRLATRSLRTNQPWRRGAGSKQASFPAFIFRRSIRGRQIIGVNPGLSLTPMRRSLTPMRRLKMLCGWPQSPRNHDPQSRCLPAYTVSPCRSRQQLRRPSTPTDTPFWIFGLCKHSAIPWVIALCRFTWNIWTTAKVWLRAGSFLFATWIEPCGNGPRTEALAQISRRVKPPLNLLGFDPLLAHRAGHDLRGGQRCRDEDGSVRDDLGEGRADEALCFWPLLGGGVYQAVPSSAAGRTCPSAPR